MSKRKKRKSATAASARIKSNERGKRLLVIPDYVVLLTWFLAAIPVAGFFYFLSEKSARGMLWSAVGTIVLAIVAVAMGISNRISERELASRTPVFFGFLDPSDERPLPNETPVGVVSLLLGNNLQVLSRSANQRVLQSKGVPFLTIGSENGKVWISTTVSDSKNQTIVRVIKNEFQAFPEHAFNPLQPDSHSLLIRDSTGTEVLRIRFLNPRRILIYGRFVLPNSTIVLIDDDGLHFPGGGGLSGLTLDMTAAPNAGVIDLG